MALESGLARAWRIYAAPAQSEAAQFTRGMVTVGVAWFVLQFFIPADWPLARFKVTIVEVALWYALLWVVRQRDEARTELESDHDGR